VILVGLGGALGALSRFAIDTAIPSRHFPTSVLVVNVLGSFFAGVLLLVAPADDVVLFAGVGFSGALTTFSSFAVNAVALWNGERRIAAVGFALGTLVACLLGVGLAALVSLFL